MPAIASVPPRSSAASAAGTSSPAGAKRIAPSSGYGRHSSPTHAAPSSRASAWCSPPRLTTKHLAAEVARDLDHDVRGAAEAVEAEALARRDAARARSAR